MAEAPGHQAPRDGEAEGVLASGAPAGAPAAGPTGEPAEGVVAEALAYVARSLVEHPDEVRVERTAGERGPTLRLHVNAADMGRVIGRNGHIARSIRQVMRAAAAKTGEHVFIEITE